MKKPLLGCLLAIVGAALTFLSERFGDYQFVATIAGVALIVIGSSQVTALQDYWLRLESASKKKADKSSDSSRAP